MSRKLAGFANAAAGTRTAVLREGAHLLIRTAQDMAPILDANKRAQSLYDPVHERRAPGGFRWVARIPAVVVIQLQQAGVMRGARVVDEPRFLAFIDDPDNRWMRTDNGRRLRNLRRVPAT